MLLAIPARLGATLISIAEQGGGIAIMAGQILRRLVPPDIDRLEFFRNMYEMGVKAVHIVAATGMFTGAIMVIQAVPLVEQFGAKQILGWSATFTTFREIGPLLIGLMFNGRVGANNTAELGTMVVTEQIDALRALAIDPITYLVVPRALSMIIMMTTLVIFGDVLALLGAMVTAYVLVDLHPLAFINSALPMLEFWDFEVGVIKASLFGVMIALTSCYFGLATTGGAPGVGRAVSKSVVASASGIYIADYLSTFILG
ncbi:MAG: ABC transporter permease [Polyangiaceae bacterium]|nr:ABC transporter permease [Polyangiaceae bacterium]